MAALVFDTSPLAHFARAGRLETLRELTEGLDRYVPQAVVDELERGKSLHPALAAVESAGWLEVVRSDGLLELQAFVEYANRLGSGSRDVGEAAVLACAEVGGHVAVLDERAGTRHGRERGVEVHGTLWLVARGVRAEKVEEQDAERLVTGLRDAEAWFPRFEYGFIPWAREAGLL